MSKYTPLEKYLANCGKDEISLNFSEIETIIGAKLPDSARVYPAWWSNVGESSNAHSHAYSWHNAGYKATPKFSEKRTVFRKSGTIPHNFTKSTYQRPYAPAKAADAFLTHPSDDKQITVGKYTFRFIQRLIPDCENGKVIKFYPQKEYNNKDNLPLAYHGKGAFCHFSINAPSTSGVYVWVAGDNIIYIGETQNLAQRFNMGYGNISPRNCYVGGQSTNCKMNKIVMEYYEKHTPIELYFYETAQYKQIEIELLRRYKTKYNVKDN